MCAAATQPLKVIPISLDEELLTQLLLRKQLETAIEMPRRDARILPEILACDAGLPDVVNC
jgi:hypothetical protein